MLVGILGGDGVPYFTDVAEPSLFYGALAGQKEQVLFLYTRNEVRDRFWRRGQDNAEFPKSIVGRLIAVEGAGFNRAQEMVPPVLESCELPKAAAI